MSEESFIKTPRQLVWTVALAFIVPVLVIVLLATFVAGGHKSGAGSDALSDEAIEQRIAPVAGFKFDLSASGPSAPRTGEELYKNACVSCHGSGVAGAPKTGDSAAWAPRIAQGFDALMKSALNGKNAMPAKGGVTNASEYEIARAVVYLTSQAGGKFKEPEPPKDAAAK